MNEQALKTVGELGAKIALELAYAKPGSDAGLLPVNSFVAELSDLAAELPPVLQPAVKQADRWIQDMFDSTGRFDEAAIKEFTRWATWLPEAAQRLQAGESVEPFACAETAVGTAAEHPAPTAAPASAIMVANGPEPETVLDIDNDGELLIEFCNESQEHLQNIEQGVLVLEQSPADAETLSTIFRAFHTFKGGAGLLNLMAIKDLAHELETVLDLARNHKLTVDTGIINLILAGGDTFKRFIEEITAQLCGKQDPTPIRVPTLELLAKVRNVVAAVQSGEVVAATPPPAAPVPGSDAPAPVAIDTPAGETPKQAPARQSGGASTPTTGGAAVKVDTLKLDALVDLVGEMVIAQSQVSQDENILAIESQRLSRNLSQLSRITKELQRTAMSLRMVPIRATFQKMTRLVRDISATQGKKVSLTMEGEDTELDRTIVEKIGDPLVHMIRNSVDHGIEGPEERVDKGKPAEGHVRLSAMHEGGNIVIRIRDDGRGLNRDKLLAKGVERGLVHEGEHLSDKEIFNLIFAAGFSTAEKVTDISGRGVGMDVVRRNIENLRGKIDIESRLGEGTTFTISLPLTLAIIDGLIVSIGEQRFILPTLSVRESFRPTKDMIKTVRQRGEMVDVRGRLSPLLRMYEFFDLKPETTDPMEAILVVIDNNGETRCLMVDQLVGKQEVVIKSLGETFKRSPAIAGGAILGDGRVGLIIDANGLVSLKGRKLSRAA